MFDYLFTEQSMPFVQCPDCNCKIRFHGGYYPTEIICQNCGAHIDLTQALQKLTYPNRKYDKDGMFIKEDKNG